MSEVVSATLVLPADVRSVGSARRALRDVMTRSGAGGHVEDAVLALSEVVTNALVHTGSAVTVVVWSSPEGTRVEVMDSGPQLPVRRTYAATAGTGRGLQLVEELTDRWGAERRDVGKAVWFEIGTVFDTDTVPRRQPATGGDTGGMPGQTVALLRAPLLLHGAWQEHAAALLREYLLHVMGEDDTILSKHAGASAALSLLTAQIPVPYLPDQPDELMVGALEPGVTADRVVLRIPDASVAHFSTLDDLLSLAASAASAGTFLGPPTQPEIVEMRRWLCGEVAQQAGSGTEPTPWRARTDVRTKRTVRADLMPTYESLAAVDGPLLATDEASIIVAASHAAVELLGYDRADDLVGCRVLVVVPTRYHQAHIAGTTLHATNGRAVLLDVPVVVPMVRADGTEVSVRMDVTPERVGDLDRVFVARFSRA